MCVFRTIWIGVLAAAVVAGCGGDDEEGSGGTNSGPLSSCNRFCDASAEKPCQLLGPAECKEDLQRAHGAISAECANKYKVMWDCYLAQADVCADGCRAETEAAEACM